MTDAERDELIEKSLLNELDGTAESRVQLLLREDELFRQEYELQKQLIQQVRAKRRQELTRMFARFEAERSTKIEEPVLQTRPVPVVPIPVPGSRNEPAPDSNITTPLWPQKWWRVAASIALIAGISAFVYWQVKHSEPAPMANGPDSTHSITPPDSQPIDSGADPVLPTPKPQGPVAQKPARASQLTGPRQLPYYEIDDLRLGFGTDKKTDEYRTVLFLKSTEATYEFNDTLKLYFPTLPPASQVWSLVYNRNDDIYYLTTDKRQYEITKGLRGKQPLVRVK